MKGSCLWTQTRWRSNWVSALLFPLLAACLWASVVGYKPVIIVHGLFDSSEDFKNLKRFINQVSCITNVELVSWNCFSVGFVLADVGQNVQQTLQLVSYPY